MIANCDIYIWNVINSFNKEYFIIIYKENKFSLLLQKEERLIKNMQKQVFIIQSLHDDVSLNNDSLKFFI